MPRRIAPQIASSVSRLLAGQVAKAEPVWLGAVADHPPVPLPPRTARESAGQGAFRSKLSQDAPLNRRLRRQATPSLEPGPIRYTEDKIREQFYKDHPWEALRPKTLVEPGHVTAANSPGKGKELRHWGRNPGPEDVVAATMELHTSHGLSLSAAYHTTLSSYYALRAEHETASRYAVLEALEIGADFGPTETERGFVKERESLDASAGRVSRDASTPQQELSQAGKSVSPLAKADVRSNAFTGGLSYLSFAQERR